MAGEGGLTLKALFLAVAALLALNAVLPSGARHTGLRELLALLASVFLFLALAIP